MSLPAYKDAPKTPRPVAEYLPPGVHPRTVAEEEEVVRSAVPGWYCEGPRWVAWRYAPAAGRDGETKLPLDPLSPGRFARANDPGTWGTLREAIDFRRRYVCDGVSRALVAGERVLAIDEDGVRDPETGELNPLAEDTLARVAGHAEVSPGGRGLHVYRRDVFPEEGRSGRRRGPVEVYAGGRFMTCTARVLRPDEAAPAAGDAEAFRRWFREQFPPTPAAAGPPPRSPLLLTDREVLERARRARNGARFEALWAGDTSGYADDHSRADAALTALLWFWSSDGAQVDRLFRRSGLYRDKWDQRRGPTTYGGRTIVFTQGSGGWR